jgi:hypothetical protein
MHFCDCCFLDLIALHNNGCHTYGRNFRTTHIEGTVVNGLGDVLAISPFGVGDAGIVPLADTILAMLACNKLKLLANLVS